MAGGEYPAHLAERYNRQVAAYFLSLSSPVNPVLRLWTLQATSQQTPHLTRFPTRGGGSANFDITFLRVRAALAEPSTSLIVETKASTNVAYVTKGFEEFLGKVAQIAEALAANHGTEHLFAFIAPVLPDSDVGPEAFATHASVKATFFENGGHDLSDAQVEAVRRRVFVIAFTPEYAAIHGIGESFGD